jgi:hypothetical protein
VRFVLMRQPVYASSCAMVVDSQWISFDADDAGKWKGVREVERCPDSLFDLEPDLNESK